MSIFTPEKRGGYLFILSMIVAKISLVVVFGVIAFEGYIRWTVNQNFTLLGGFELEALTICAFALLLGLTYINRAEK